MHVFSRIGALFLFHRRSVLLLFAILLLAPLVGSQTVFAEDWSISPQQVQQITSKSLQVFQLSDTSVGIEWKAFPIAVKHNNVKYGINPSQLSASSSEPCLQSRANSTNCVVLRGLVPHTLYYYKVSTADAYDRTEYDIGGQFSITPGRQNIDLTNYLSHPLRMGNRNDDVKILQGILALEGILSHENITGYFGLQTHAGIIAFQDKYAREILWPLGLKHGTGFVGTLTLKKLNALSGY